jgi:hypothetical protein
VVRIFKLSRRTFLWTILGPWVLWGALFASWVALYLPTFTAAPADMDGDTVGRGLISAIWLIILTTVAIYQSVVTLRGGLAVVVSDDWLRVPLAGRLSRSNIKSIDFSKKISIFCREGPWAGKKPIRIDLSWYEQPTELESSLRQFAAHLE